MEGIICATVVASGVDVEEGADGAVDDDDEPSNVGIPPVPDPDPEDVNDAHTPHMTGHKT